jgi:hypothetical protein
LVCEQLGW